MKLIDYNADKLIRSIYGGEVDVNNLPVELYNQLSKKLESHLFEGFGGKLKDFNPKSMEYKLLVDLRENIYFFSAAKTYQQVVAIKKEAKSNPSYTDYKAKSNSTFDQFNQVWFQTEVDTTLGQAQSAKKWQDIQNEKDIFPFLEYDAVLDKNTSDICRPLDGIVLSVDDPFWNTHSPLNHFNCRCMLKKVSGLNGRKVTSHDKIVEVTKEMAKEMQPLFMMNPGKDRVVFMDSGKGKHPYFDVPKKDVKLAAKNFNLPIPK